MRIEDFIKNALEEDLGRGDLFSLVGEEFPMKARIICKDEGVFAGQIYIEAFCKICNLSLDLKVKDGDEIKNGDIIANLSGISNTLIKCERTMLNFIQHASGIATKTRTFVKALNGIDVKLLDTRKTRPGLRILEKYATRCGGGHNHRLGLDDCLMLKDTHLRNIEDWGEFFKKARKKIPFTSKIEVECDTKEEAFRAMKAGADIVMCDAMNVETIKEIIAHRNEFYPSVLLEASGNITDENIYEYASTGVDAISSGSTIHKASWLDFSMRLFPKV